MKPRRRSRNGRPSKSGERFLEAHSQTDDTTKSRDILDGQLRESYGRVVYSHKTHEKCADILLARQGWIRLAQIGLSAITTAGFIGGGTGDGTSAGDHWLDCLDDTVGA